MLNAHRGRTIFLALIVLITFSGVAAGQDRSVVPGKRVGELRLGASRQKAHEILGKPTETARWKSGITKDTWMNTQSDSQESQAFVFVLCRANRIVQIEFNDPRYVTVEGVSSESTLTKFRRKYKSPSVQAFGYDDGEGSGYVTYYYDSVSRGITFTLETQDKFDAEVVPYSLCVHPAGRPVIPNPNGKRYKPTDELPIKKSRTTRSSLQHVTKVPDTPEGVIRSFWQGLGELDFDKMKSVVDLPLTLIEVSETNSRASKVFRNPAELDEEFKKAPAGAVEKHRSEFYGTKLLAFRVAMLSPSLVSVSYSYRLPHELVMRNPQRKDRIFTGLTLVRRDAKEGNRWRIVLITIPA